MYVRMYVRTYLSNIPSIFHLYLIVLNSYNLCLLVVLYKIRKFKHQYLNNQSHLRKNMKASNLKVYLRDPPSPFQLYIEQRTQDNHLSPAVNGCYQECEDTLCCDNMGSGWNKVAKASPASRHHSWCERKTSIK